MNKYGCYGLLMMLLAACQPAVITSTNCASWQFDALPPAWYHAAIAVAAKIPACPKQVWHLSLQEERLDQIDATYYQNGSSNGQWFYYRVTLSASAGHGKMVIADNWQQRKYVPQNINLILANSQLPEQMMLIWRQEAMIDMLLKTLHRDQQVYAKPIQSTT